MLRVPIAVFVLASLAVPAAAADAACRDGARVTQTRSEDPLVLRSAVYVCASGRERVVRRGRLRLGGRPVAPRSGTILADADARAGRFAIGAVRVRRGGRTGEVELRALRDGRRLFRRAWRAPDRPDRAAPDLVLTADGDLAWREPRRDRSPLFVRRTDGSSELVRGSIGTSTLAVEDGRTLRWGVGFVPYEFFDVRPVRSLGTGCPVRKRFRTIADDGQVAIRRADYPPYLWTFRACLRGSRRDVVIGGGLSISEDFADAKPVLVRAPYVVVHDLAFGKYGTEPSTLTRFDLRSGAALRLDHGELTDVRAEGDTVHWRHGSVEREATLPAHP